MTKIRTPEEPGNKPIEPKEQETVGRGYNDPENNPFGIPIPRPQPLGSQLPSSPGQDVWY